MRPFQEEGGAHPLAAAQSAAPVTWLERDRDRPPEDGLGLCLSGGGNRAMLFHAGALLRIHELGMFPELKRVSSVSGGSIANGVLGLNWTALREPAVDSSATFRRLVVEPLRTFARQHVDIFAWIRGTLTPGSSPVERLADILDEYLYHGRTLQDLPDDPPRFVFNATNLSTGVLWRFSKPYMADYRLGRVPNPRVRLAHAVAASSAFPPFFSPLHRRIDPDSYLPDDEGEPPSSLPPDELRRFRERPHLTDGGVYDNLGLETVWKRYRDVLASDGGGDLRDDATPPTDLILQTIRVLMTSDRQVRALRRQLLIRSYDQRLKPGIGWRGGAYWGVRTDIAGYRLPDALPCPHQQTLLLASEPTRLWRMPELTQERLINWGYAVADAAIRRWYRPGPPPGAFPYPASGVGASQIDR